MLYLAELNKPNFGRSTLQLLARQQQDSWQSVNEEVIQLEGKSAQDVSRLKDGVLVLVEIGNNRQITRINEAAKQLVTYLQNFSRLQEKARSQGEEIDTWKQSLTFQSQELNRREMEIEAQEEELHRLHERYQTIEAELKALEAKREEITTQEAHISEQQKVIGQQREVLNRQLEDAQAGRLGEAEAAQLTSLITQLEQDLQAIADPSASLQPLKEWLDQRQQELDQALAQLNEERQQAQHRQAELDQALPSWQERRQEWVKNRLVLDNTRAEWRVQESTHKIRQEQIQKLIQQVQLQEAINLRAYGLVRDHDFITATGAEHPDQEPTISIEELRGQVYHLRRDYEQRTGLLNQQLAELEQNRQILLDLQAKLVTASADDRFDIEMDIDYAQSACGALELTVSPQQENMQRQYEELVRQEARLAQLEGKSNGTALSSMPTVDIGPLLAQLEEQKLLLQGERNRLENQLQQVGETLRTQQDTLNQQQNEIDQQWKALETEEGSLRTQLQTIAETWGRLNERQQTLTHEQERLAHLRQQTEQWALAQQPESSHNCQSHIQAVKLIIASLTGSS